MTDFSAQARAAYDAFAPHYDFFTASHDYEAWTASLAALLPHSAASRRRLLDVACGTGKSFVPMLRRGWSVVGCDASEAMLLEAARKAPGIPLVACDMRRLPRLGSFDVVWCLDDALNYLLDPGQLEQAFAGMRRNLAPGGALLFDVNTLATYRGFFASHSVVSAEDRVVVWEGLADPDFHAGGRAEAAVTAFSRRGGGWQRTRALHRQRHHRPREISAALARAGLECLAVHGQGLDGVPVTGLDELHHTKAVYVARVARPLRRRREEVSKRDPDRAPGSSPRVGGVRPEGQLTPTRGAA